MSTIRFVGHTGEITALSRLHAKSMFVFDANTVLTLIRHADQQTRLDEPHLSILRETRKRIRRQWTERETFLPVDPVLALMELTKQDISPDFTTYLPKFEHFFNAVYGVNNLDRSWVRLTYEPAMRLRSSVHHSISLTLQQILAAVPTSGTLDHKTIIGRVDNFLTWVLSERDQLTMIGGPLLQLAVYAIAGSPEAHRFLKLAKIPKTSSDAVARNVAWDFMHWVNLDFHYHYAKYPSTIVCTSDQALADFLLARRNLGPRAGREAVLNAGAVNSFGVLTLSKLSRIDGTLLGDEIAQRLLEFWRQISQDPGDEVWFTPLSQ